MTIKEAISSYNELAISAFQRRNLGSAIDIRGRLGALYNSEDLARALHKIIVQRGTDLYEPFLESGDIDISPITYVLLYPTFRRSRS